ncbi:MAG: NADH-quinone oxidoreductase subunit D [Nitrososphaerota archaeon]|nr:NADH-quinone oxidoreductase subunit D [Nitrososphaerota archaeon]MDG6939537.1 NADH-quinone oxidoreductase subunit D [Nitrososphaerota archaeon]
MSSTNEFAAVFEREEPPEGKLKVSFGPQHPGSGQFRIILTIDGDIVEEAVPDPGFVHRGVEKMCEYKTYIQNIPHIERPVIHDSSGVLFAYALAVERLLGMSEKIPERAQYIRVIMAELNRIVSHEYFLAILGIFLGHSTAFTWCMGDREALIDAAGALTGARVTFSYLVPGGVRTDTPPGFEEKLLKACDYIESRIPVYKQMMFDSPFMKMRMEGVGVIGRQEAIDHGLAGPTLRASGVDSDVRKDEPYSLYDTLDFAVPVRKEGDIMSRLLLHMDEMEQSIGIIRQAVRRMRPGPVKLPLRGQVRGAVGDAYARTEAARGVNSYYIISDGQIHPYRVRINTPSGRNLAIMARLLTGARVADVPILHWSLDYWPLEADR